jgi:Uma2 family endonuclease
VLVPELAGWRRERMPQVPMAASAFELAPDWICEVLSPGTGATNRAHKVPLYAAEGVSHVWLVDPILRTLEVLRVDGPTYRVVGTWRDDAVVRAEPFDAVELHIASLWAT